ncbi:hypothetical protein [Methyloversatilis universalis]|uniref:hypothetical protein n=1 Tax=Methyloversatilis universalis TaxID=378211 RepID=UPI000374874A|nr:hypothetical protein [Methyloversatilis universalis]
MSLKNLEQRLRKAEAEAQRKAGDGLPVLFITIPDFWEPDGCGSFRVSARYASEGSTAAHDVIVRQPGESIAELEERCRRDHPGRRVFMATQRPGPSLTERKPE